MLLKGLIITTSAWGGNWEEKESRFDRFTCLSVRNKCHRLILQIVVNKSHSLIGFIKAVFSSYLEAEKRLYHF